LADLVGVTAGELGMDAALAIGRRVGGIDQRNLMTVKQLVEVH
jgi:hypothetical protein